MGPEGPHSPNPSFFLLCYLSVFRVLFFFIALYSFWLLFLGLGFSERQKRPFSAALQDLWSFSQKPLPSNALLFFLSFLLFFSSSLCFLLSCRFLVFSCVCFLFFLLLKETYSVQARGCNIDVLKPVFSNTVCLFCLFCKCISLKTLFV